MTPEFARSDRRHLGWAKMAAALLLIVGLGMGFQNEASHRQRLTRQTQVQAKILADSLVAPLAFSDVPTMQSYLDALRADSRVAEAWVSDSQGRRLVVFDRGQSNPAHSPARAPRAIDLEVSEPVSQNGMTMGSVHLRTVREPLGAIFQRHAALALLTVMAFFLLWLVGRATRQLERRAAALADANARLEAEMAERSRVEEALRQSQKMEALGQLTGGVAHDFNNLLTVIMGGLETIGRQLGKLDTTADTARLLRARDMALHGAERAATLTQRLLAFSRRQPLQPRVIDPGRLVVGITDLLQRTLGETIELETVVGAGAGRARVDPAELENALVNLAVNARDAMPAGGRLTIETANASLDEAYVSKLVEAVEPGPYILIAVTDTGVGMDAQTVSQVFEPFFTTKEVGKGTGLGLSQVYGFVRQSGGHVAIYSELGAGTTVKLYLPRQAAAADPLVESARKVDTSSLIGDEKILLVEDHPELRLYSSGILKELGYTVCEAGDAAQALEILAAEPGIAMLFTDVVLPGGVNGRLLADAALKARPDLKVLFTTGYTRNAIVHNGALDHGVHLITKPFTFDDLALKIRAVLDGRPTAGASAAPAARAAAPPTP